MRNGKYGLKAFVLSAVVILGTMALAAGAQAQTHTELLFAHAEHNESGGILNPNPLTHMAGSTLGQFLVNLGHVNLPVSITAALEGTRVFLIAERSIEVRCTGLTLSSGTINNLSNASGEVTFTGCKVFDHKTLQEVPGCLFKTLETIKMKLVILPIIHGGEAFLIFEPPEASPFTTVSFKPGIGCTLPLNNPVAGSFSALVEELDAVTHTLLFSEAIQLLTGNLLSFGTSPAYYTAQIRLELSGSHLGQKLGIH